LIKSKLKKDKVIPASTKSKKISSSSSIKSPYDKVMLYVKSLTPSQLDSQIRSIGFSSVDEVKDLELVFDFILYSLETKQKPTKIPKNDKTFSRYIDKKMLCIISSRNSVMFFKAKIRKHQQRQHQQPASLEQRSRRQSSSW